MAYSDSPEYAANIEAAALGCGLCGGHVQTPSKMSSDPFSQGPYRGRYWCHDCWALYWDEHPECLADSASRRYNAEEATRIRKGRHWEILFEDGENHVYLTERGTIIILLEPKEGFGVGEYHPEQFQTLLRMIRELDQKQIYGFTLMPAPAPEPEQIAEG
jgi:hypothetical protein